MGESIRELHGRWKRMVTYWQPGQSEARGRARIALDKRSEELRKALPVQTGLVEPESYTAHIIIREELRSGRFTRQPGELLCGKKYPRLRGVSDAATCLKCLEIAERLVQRKEP